MQQVNFNNLDKKSKVQIGITAVLILVFIVILINSIWTVKTKIKPEHAPSGALKRTAQPLIAKQQTVIKKSTKEAVEKYRNLPWGRDPFQLSERSSMIGLKLQGITRHKDGLKAIISGEIVGVGDMVGQNKVIRINRNNVVVNDGTNNITLTID